MADINQLIAMGGRNVASPAERYMQTRKEMGAERRGALAEQQAIQSMDINRQKQQMLQQEQATKNMASLAQYLDTIPEGEQREAAFQAAVPKFQSQGLPPAPQGATYESVKPKLEQAKLQVFGAPAEKWVQGVSPTGAPMQQSTTTGKQISGITHKKSGQTINIDTKGESELAKSLNKAYGKDLIDRRNDAIQARDSLIATNDAIDLLDSGVITGTGAEFITSAGKALRRLGIDYFEDDVKNTEAYYANQAKQVAQVIKAFGAGTGLSDADREYAEKAAAGKITMSEESLRKIIEMNQSASFRVIENVNKDISRIDKGVMPFDLSIETPIMKSPAKKTEEWAIERL
jgi:hypothetical protein